MSIVDTAKVGMPFAYTASYPAFECCCCTQSDGNGNVVERPLYASVNVCRHCGDLCCAQDTVDGLCLACYYERGSTWDEPQPPPKPGAEAP